MIALTASMIFKRHFDMLIYSFCLFRYLVQPNFMAAGSKNLVQNPLEGRIESQGWSFKLTFSKKLKSYVLEINGVNVTELPQAPPTEK